MPSSVRECSEMGEFCSDERAPRASETAPTVMLRQVYSDNSAPTGMLRLQFCSGMLGDGQFVVAVEMTLPAKQAQR